MDAGRGGARGVRVHAARGTAAAAEHVSVIQMGGDLAESQATRATEASVRGFWKAYRRHMGY